MVIPHFRKGQVNGEIAVLGITNSVKKKPPVSGNIYQGGSYGADDCDFKRMEAAWVRRNRIMASVQGCFLLINLRSDRRQLQIFNGLSDSLWIWMDAYEHCKSPLTAKTGVRVP